MKTVLIRGGGDLSTAVIQKLHRSGFWVIVKELEQPRMVRRTVSLSNAVYEGKMDVEDIKSCYVVCKEEVRECFEKGLIPVVTMEESDIFETFRPEIFIDATLSKRKPNYNKYSADIVIGLGPGICAGEDAHVVIETNRGHNLGRLIFEGKAQENTHIPGSIKGFTHERVLRAPCEGELSHKKEIGDLVKAGDVITEVNGIPVKSKLDGVIRGLIHPKVKAREGLKLGDVDPRGDKIYCHTISEKGRNIAGGVLEAILINLNKE